MSKFRKIVAVCALISLLSTLVIGASPLVQVQASDELVRPVYGDGDYYQKAAAGDALLVLQISVSNASYELNPATPTAAETRKDMPFLYSLDVNGDFTIDAADALLILQRSVGLIGSFPVEHSGVYEVYYEEDMAN